MVIKIVPNDKGIPSGKLADASCTSMPASSPAETSVRSLGAPQRQRSQRDVSIACLLGQRGTQELRAPAADGRGPQSGSRAGPDPARLHRVRVAGRDRQLTGPAPPRAHLPVTAVPGRTRKPNATIATRSPERNTGEWRLEASAEPGKRA